MLADVGGHPFDNIMLIDGNDPRGIDVGLMTRATYDIGWMQSHVDDRTTLGEYVFSRDCPEYGVRTPSRETVWVLVNHFKSKGYGNQDDFGPQALAAGRMRAPHHRAADGGEGAR